MSFEFAPGVNIIVGPNASGKTNLLEAVLVTAHGQSYRAKDAELIAFAKPWARLAATLEDGERVVKLVRQPASKSYDIAGKTYQRLSLQHTLPVVLFEPNHLLLLGGAPEERRNYLDDLLEQTVAGYGSVRRNYRRVLRQRNSLLKRAKRPNNQELFPWNLRLSELGAVVARRRIELAAQINKAVGARYKNLSGSKLATEFVYQPQFQAEAYESQFLHTLEQKLATDLERGFTGSGPHREDFSALFAGRPASESASRGETRTYVLALKIIELEILETIRGTRPLLLLDDVFSELDGKRRHALTDQLKTYQTFITTTDADIIQKAFTTKAQIIPLGNQSNSH